MESIQCRSVLLDIEGTVSPVAFVLDVMFPYVRQHVAAFLERHWQDPSVRQAVAGVGRDVGQDDVDRWLSGPSEKANQGLVCQAVNELMDRDAKVTGLKQLQGLIWRNGFESGELVSRLFPDVLPRLRQWKAQGLQLLIYSSGSVAAQKLFFGHTTEGNLLDLFDGFFDTTCGNKRQASSYTAIAGQIDRRPESVCFISDVTAELDAAATAGMQTVWRPADDSARPAPHPRIDSFEQLEISCS